MKFNKRDFNLSKHSTPWKLKNDSVIKIQSFWRGYSSRQL